MNSPGEPNKSQKEDVLKRSIKLVFPDNKVVVVVTRATWQNVPRTRSSITWDKTFTTVMFPIRAKAMDAADRMKSPTKMAWRMKHSYGSFLPGNRDKEGLVSASLTFFSPQTLLMVLFPRRWSDPSITSSCTRLAVWIISEIIATALWPGSKSLMKKKWDHVKADPTQTQLAGLHPFRVTLMWFHLPISVTVDVERPGHQDHYHWSNGLPLAVKIVVAQKLELFFGHKKLLQG